MPATTSRVTFDTTPTVQDIAAAGHEWAALVAECHGMGLVDYARYRKAQQVAIELGVVMRLLVGVDEHVAREAARERALYEKWVRP